jgi:hypothetical protein
MGPNRTLLALALAVGPLAALGREQSAGPLGRLGGFFSGRGATPGGFSPTEAPARRVHAAAAALAVLASAATSDEGPAAASEGPVAGGAAEPRELDEVAAFARDTPGKPMLLLVEPFGCILGLTFTPRACTLAGPQTPWKW